MKYGQFRIVPWDFFLLFGQIMCMQFCNYSALGAVLLLISYVLEESIPVSSLFKYDVLWVSKYDGCIIFWVFVIHSVLAAILLWLIVNKTKLCLDFSSTFYGLHLIICWWYNSSFPTNISWWFLIIVTSAIMCIGGEFLCLKSEFKKIPIGYGINHGKTNV